MVDHMLSTPVLIQNYYLYTQFLTHCILEKWLETYTQKKKRMKKTVQQRVVFCPIGRVSQIVVQAKVCLMNLAVYKTDRQSAGLKLVLCLMIMLTSVLCLMLVKKAHCLTIIRKLHSFPLPCKAKLSWVCESKTTHSHLFEPFPLFHCLLCHVGKE